MALICFVSPIGCSGCQSCAWWQFMMLTGNGPFARKSGRLEKSTRVIKGGYLSVVAYIFPTVRSRLKKDVVAQSVYDSGCSKCCQSSSRKMLKRWKSGSIRDSMLSGVYDCWMAWIRVAIDIYQDWAMYRNIRHRKWLIQKKAKTRLFWSDVLRFQQRLNIAESMWSWSSVTSIRPKSNMKKLDSLSTKWFVEELRCFHCESKDYLDTGLFCGSTDSTKLIPRRANG